MIFLLASILLVSLLGMALYNLFTAPRLEEYDSGARLPRVSLLVAVHGEEAVWRARLLPALARLEYANLEIVLLGEDTAALEAFAAQHPTRVRVLDGGELPANWAELDWYADQLAGAATGEILIFCDAGVTMSPRAVARTVHAIETLGTAALSALPRQQFATWQERALVPFVLQLPIAGIAPLRRLASVGARHAGIFNLWADGSWFAVRRDAYDAIGGHAELPESGLAARELARRLATEGKVAAVVAAQDLAIRRYPGADAVWEGLTRQTHALLGGNVAALAVAIALHVLVFVAPWVAALTFRSGGFLALCLLVAFRVTVARLFGAAGVDMIHHPVGSLLMPGVAVDAFWRKMRAARTGPGSLRLTTLDSQASAP